MKITLEQIAASAVAGKNQHLFTEAGKMAKSKYGNKKVVVDGISFDSKREANRYFELKIMKAAGEITELQLQVTFQLSVCKYVADFVYQRGGVTVVEDAKGFKTKTYLLKKKMIKSELGVTIKEV